MRPLQTVVAALILLSFGLPARSAPEEPRVGAAKVVAGRYYALLKEAGERVEEPSRPSASPPHVTGIVVDRRGRPVASAQVVVQSWGEEQFGAGRTGADGRFDIQLTRKTDEDLGLTVTAPGFARWAVAGSYKPHQLVGYRVRLDRELGRDFMTALAAEPDPESRIWGLLEIVGDRQLGFKVAAVFPYLGALRADLRAIVESKAFTRPDDPPREGSPDDQARELLAYWGDPADEPLVGAWMRVRRGVRSVPPFTGDDLFSVCGTYAQYTSQQEDVAPRFSCLEAAADAARTRALYDLNVRYAHWGYTEHLVLKREGTAWKLRFVVEGERVHASE